MSSETVAQVLKRLNVVTLRETCGDNSCGDWASCKVHWKPTMKLIESCLSDTTSSSQQEFYKACEVRPYHDSEGFDQVRLYHPVHGVFCFMQVPWPVIKQQRLNCAFASESTTQQRDNEVVWCDEYRMMSLILYELSIVRFSFLWLGDMSLLDPVTKLLSDPQFERKSTKKCAPAPIVDDS